MHLVRVSFIVLSVMLAASCSGRADERPRAERAAADFYNAIAQQDGTTACVLLAPETKQEVEKAAKQPCEQAITDEDLPADLGIVSATEINGNEAIVTAVGDTVFVSDFYGQWKIVAAGCSPQGDLPYDCELKGG